MATLRASPIVEPGNIDLDNRPVVFNADGSISTVRSITIEEDGNYVVLPTVPPDGGRIMPDDEAIRLYHETNKHLGIFKSGQAADAYAAKLHTEQAKRYDTERSPSMATLKASAPTAAIVTDPMAQSPELTGTGEQLGDNVSFDEYLTTREDILASAKLYEAIQGYAFGATGAFGTSNERDKLGVFRPAQKAAVTFTDNPDDPAFLRQGKSGVRELVTLVGRKLTDIPGRKDAPARLRAKDTNNAGFDPVDGSRNTTPVNSALTKAGMAVATMGFKDTEPASKEYHFATAAIAEAKLAGDNYLAEKLSKRYSQLQLQQQIVAQDLQMNQQYAGMTLSKEAKELQARHQSELNATMQLIKSEEQVLMQGPEYRSLLALQNHYTLQQGKLEKDYAAELSGRASLQKAQNELTAEEQFGEKKFLLENASSIELVNNQYRTPKEQQLMNAALGTPQTKTAGENVLQLRKAGVATPTAIAQADAIVSKYKDRSTFLADNILIPEEEQSTLNSLYLDQLPEGASRDFGRQVVANFTAANATAATTDLLTKAGSNKVTAAIKDVDAQMQAMPETSSPAAKATIEALADRRRSLMAQLSGGLVDAAVGGSVSKALESDDVYQSLANQITLSATTDYAGGVIHLQSQMAAIADLREKAWGDWKQAADIATKAVQRTRQDAGLPQLSGKDEATLVVALLKRTTSHVNKFYAGALQATGYDADAHLELLRTGLEAKGFMEWLQLATSTKPTGVQ